MFYASYKLCRAILRPNILTAVKLMLRRDQQQHSLAEYSIWLPVDLSCI